jgi:hypothetical protein
MVPSVMKNEGLHSPKAIAFIFDKGNRRSSKRLEKKTYSTRQILKKVTELLKQTKPTVNSLKVSFIKNLGDKIWTK